MTTYLNDPDDICRVCNGLGIVEEKTERNTWLTERCDQCGGSGYRSVRCSSPDAVESASPASQLAGGGTTQSPGTACLFSSPRDAWVHDNLPRDGRDRWDLMRDLERTYSGTLHDPVCRDLREKAYMERRGYYPETQPVQSFILAVSTVSILMLIGFVLTL